MKSFIQILGSSSATPAWGRFMTSQLLCFNDEYCLIDCGEGTQYQLKNFKIKSSKIKYIFISHLHGDHYFGLPGLLSSFNLLGRTQPIYIFGPPALREVLVSISKASGTYFSFKIHFIDTQSNKLEKILDVEGFSAYSFPLDHRIACTGFLFKEAKGKAKLIFEKLPFDFPYEYRRSLKNGENVIWQNITYSPSDYTLPPSLGKNYAFCSDTAYSEDIIPFINNVDVLYHEATFTNEDLARAEKTRHSTATQAATIALKAKVGKLIIGHFSTRYKDLNILLEEAKQVFTPTFLAIEGEKVYL